MNWTEQEVPGPVIEACFCPSIDLICCGNIWRETHKLLNPDKLSVGNSWSVSRINPANSKLKFTSLCFLEYQTSYCFDWDREILSRVCSDKLILDRRTETTKSRNTGRLPTHQTTLKGILHPKNTETNERKTTTRPVCWVLRNWFGAHHPFRENFNTLCSLVPSSIDKCFFRTVYGARLHNAKCQHNFSEIHNLLCLISIFFV